jgi:hypothetical protein
MNGLCAAFVPASLALRRKKVRYWVKTSLAVTTYDAARSAVSVGVNLSELSSGPASAIRV